MEKEIRNKYLYNYCRILGEGYVTGDFSSIYEFLADDCVWESQWRLTPETGKEAVIAYFQKKGKILRESDSSIKYLIVELVDSFNPVNARINGENEVVSVGMVYETGKIALFMAQDLNDVTSGTIIDLKLDDDKKISRIDICMPELFKFKKYETIN